MPHVRESVEIAVPAETLWAMLNDPELPLWNSVTDIEYRDRNDDPLPSAELGARMHGTIHAPSHVALPEPGFETVIVEFGDGHRMDIVERAPFETGGRVLLDVDEMNVEWSRVEVTVDIQIADRASGRLGFAKRMVGSGAGLVAGQTLKQVFRPHFVGGAQKLERYAQQAA